MQRREFVTALCGAAAWPLVAQAQPERMRLIGVLGGFPENDPEHQRRFAALLQGLRELGWIEGKNFRIEYRWVTNDVERMRANVRELVKLHPDLLIADNANPPATVALQKGTTTIPIIAGFSMREIAETLAWEEESVEKIIRRYVGRSATIKARIRKLESKE